MSLTRSPHSFNFQSSIFSYAFYLASLVFLAFRRYGARTFLSGRSWPENRPGPPFCIVPIFIIHTLITSHTVSSLAQYTRPTAPCRSLATPD
jgi:hypothetical protein